MGVAAIVAAIGLTTAPGAAAKSLTHTFDTTNQDWEFGGAMSEASATWSGVSGNPAGSITGTDSGADASEPGARFVGPTAFHGNYTTSIGGTISFDLASDDDASNGRTVQLFLVDVGDATLVRQFIPIDGPGFHRYAAPLTAGAWEGCVLFDVPPCPLVTADQLAFVLQSIDRVGVSADIVAGTGEGYLLDNFSVSEPPPTPTAATPPATVFSAPPQTAPATRCPKGKKLVVKKGKRKCKRRRKK